MKRPFVAGPVWPPLTRLAPAPVLPLRPCCVKSVLPKGAAEEEPVVEAARAPAHRCPTADGVRTAPRSSQKARGPRDRWAGLAARGSSRVLASCGVAWPGSQAALAAFWDRQRVPPSTWVERRRWDCSARTSPTTSQAGGSPALGARDGQLEERFLTWVCPVPQNHLWSLFKGGKRCPHLISRDSDSVGLGLLGEITGILILGGESLQS